MKIQRAGISECPHLQGAVVVIDVLRSFTTAACALARGAAQVLMADSAEAALCLREAERRALTIGSLAGGAPMPGLELGNSPSRLAGLDLSDRTIILVTTGGVRALLASVRAEQLFAGALVCARATAAAVLACAPQSVTLVNTGRWTDRDGDEDEACADLLEALLRGDDPPRGPFVDRVRASDFGRRFAAGSDPHLPAADLDRCAAADVYDFAMPVEPRAPGRVIRRVEQALRPGLPQVKPLPGAF